ncbi:MAG: AraC family transcriptional regulator [Gammaproteobacteria bacterium]
MNLAAMNAEGVSAPARTGGARTGARENRPGDPGASNPGDCPDRSRPVRTLAQEHESGQSVARHSHRRAQLLYAACGVMEAVTARGAWVVPPRQAVWIPAGVEHEVRYRTRASIRSLYVHASRAERMSAECMVVNVSPLLAELVMKLVEMDPGNEGGGRCARLIDVLLDELDALQPAPLHLPLPEDARLRPIVDALQSDPGDNRSLEQWADIVGASARTLARAFVADTGLSFGAWRQQLKLHEAMTRLGDGQSITAVALDLGYQSPSAFIAMFRRALGAPPARYFRDFD